MADSKEQTIDWAKVNQSDPTDLVNAKYGKYKDPVDGSSVEERLGAVGPMAPAPSPMKGMK